MAHHQKRRLPYRGGNSRSMPSSLFGSRLSRAADEPFCAHIGPRGETCAETAGLEEVLSMSGPPKLVWMACPTHREQMWQLASAFMQRATSAPQTVAFRYQGTTYETRVRATDKFHA